MDTVISTTRRWGNAWLAVAVYFTIAYGQDFFEGLRGLPEDAQLSALSAKQALALFGKPLIDGLIVIRALMNGSWTAAQQNGKGGYP